MNSPVRVIVVTPDLARLPSLQAWLDRDVDQWIETDSPRDVEAIEQSAEMPSLVVYDMTGDHLNGAATAETIARSTGDPVVITSAEPVPARVWSDAIYYGIADVMVEPYTRREANMVFDRAIRVPDNGLSYETAIDFAYS